MSAGRRVVRARKGRSSMVKVMWTPDSPPGLNEPDVAEELGARWDGEELVAEDFADFMENYEQYENDEWMIDND